MAKHWVDFDRIALNIKIGKRYDIQRNNGVKHLDAVATDMGFETYYCLIRDVGISKVYVDCDNKSEKDAPIPVVEKKQWIFIS